MEWLSQNWLWLVLVAGVILMMRRGGGCCGASRSASSSNRLKRMSERWGRATSFSNQDDIAASLGCAGMGGKSFLAGNIK